ncbi:shikimate dehydrogenase [Vogesella sp. LIG4]|uniref:shikimate dehydrogenase n=1 Tax=Vogesella sp. LIG4 TaxID=1192162 RepID=UPI00081FE761|nr:shikimate dehydrogenase [Vogesella sp. LIG4]SCK08875.1 shikimate dehydrogenase [Vogesella sp. LIG4]
MNNSISGTTTGNSDKVLIGLIGADIQRSKSPFLHEQEASAAGLRLQYQLLDLTRLGKSVDDLPTLLAAAESCGFAGVNITHPCKQAVIPFLDELSPDARQIGAVNTVVFRNGKRYGYNTDCSGFAEPFRRNFTGRDLRQVVLLGAGGAGSAVAQALLGCGVQTLLIVDQDPARAQALADKLQGFFPERRVRGESDVARAMAEASGLVHATPTGMDGHPGLPLPAELIHGGLWVAEVVYFPLETALLKLARERGCRVLDGGGMAVWQAVGAFELFTGRAPDSARMEQHFRDMIARG